MIKKKYCCERFSESVKEEIFVRASDEDESEWFMAEWLHIYYCPFCGAFVKGKGWGEYHGKANPAAGVRATSKNRDS